MFLEAAKDDLRAERVDLAAFHAEQASQLTLKYVLAVQVGYYPHTHSLRRLFEEVRAVRLDLWQLYERYMWPLKSWRVPIWGLGIFPGGTVER